MTRENGKVSFSPDEIPGAVRAAAGAEAGKDNVSSCMTPAELREADYAFVQSGALTEQQLKIVGAMSSPSMHVDDIIDLTGLPASAVLSELTLLQIRGFVSQEQGKRFTLNISK